MKLLLITKEDWSNASLGLRIFNVIFDVVNLFFLVITILAIADWTGFL